jgi:hypothetical protein
MGKFFKRDNHQLEALAAAEKASTNFKARKLVVASPVKIMELH